MITAVRAVEEFGDLLVDRPCGHPVPMARCARSSTTIWTSSARSPTDAVALLHTNIRGPRYYYALLLTEYAVARPPDARRIARLGHASPGCGSTSGAIRIAPEPEAPNVVVPPSARREGIRGMVFSCPQLPARDGAACQSADGQNGPIRNRALPHREDRHTRMIPTR